MDTEFMNSITKHLQFEHAFNNPWYRLYPDIGNLSAWPENNVDAELAKGVGSMVACHLKDTLFVTPAFQGKFKNVEFGEGNVNFAHCFTKLDALGYNGPYTIERWFVPGGNDRRQISRSLRYLQEQFALAAEETA